MKLLGFGIFGFALSQEGINLEYPITDVNDTLLYDDYDLGNFNASAFERGRKKNKNKRKFNEKICRKTEIYFISHFSDFQV